MASSVSFMIYFLPNYSHWAAEGSAKNIHNSSIEAYQIQACPGHFLVNYLAFKMDVSQIVQCDIWRKLDF